MKANSKELDVDFIGGQKPITNEELLAVSDFIRINKEKRRLQALRKKTKSKPVKKAYQSA